VTTATTKGVGKRTLSGISWTLVGTLLSNLVRIVTMAALARLIAPSAFGVVAAAMIVIMFARRVKDAGVGLALVQRKEITQAHIAATFWFSTGFGAILTLAIIVAAHPLARALGSPEAAVPLQGLASLFLIRGVCSASQYVLQRELRFRALALVDMVTYAVGSVTSIVLALMGMGTWALVVGYIVESVLEALLLVIAAPPGRKLGFRWADLKELLGFGGGQTLAQFANYFANQGDYIVVSRYLDSVVLGFYTRAYDLMRFPATVFTNVAGTVLFSSFARLQDEPERLGQAFKRVLFANALLLLPASAGLAVLAPEFIRLLLGKGWESAVVPFQIMTTSMLWRTSHKAASIIARSTGDVMKIAGYQALYAGAVVLGAMFSVRWGIAGVATTTSLAVFFHFTNLSRLALNNVPLGWLGLARAHLDGLVRAALAIGPGYGVAALLRAHSASALEVVVLATIAGVLLPGLYAFVQLRCKNPEWVWLLDRVRSVIAKKRGPKTKKNKQRSAGDTEAPPA